MLKAHSQPDATIYSEIERKKTECQREKNMIKCRSGRECEEREGVVNSKGGKDWG